MIIKKIRGAKRKIRILSPYYYPIDDVDDELIKAAERGVDVEIITARKRDIPCYRNMKNFFLMNKLIKGGIKVYQVKDRYLHMKGLCFDDAFMTFGSFNLDKWSWDNNIELNFACENEIQLRKFNEVYKKVRKECLSVEKPTPVTLLNRMKILFWTVFLTACNFTMNYRRIVTTDARNAGSKRFYYEKILGDKPITEEEIPEDITLYKRVYYEWDECIGVD